MNAIVAESQVIRGRLLYRTETSTVAIPAKGVKVVLFPRSTATERLSNNLFFYGDDNNQLATLKAVVVSTNDAGYYYFSNIKSGSYILKVCTSYGMQYRFTVKTNNYKLLNIKDLPVSYNSRLGIN